MKAAQTITDLVKEEEKKYDAWVETLQQQYEERTLEYNERMDAIKEENDFKFIEQVFKKRNIKSPFRLNDLDDLMLDDDDDIDDDDDDEDLSGGEL